MPEPFGYQLQPEIDEVAVRKTDKIPVHGHFFKLESVFCPQQGSQILLVKRFVLSWTSVLSPSGWFLSCFRKAARPWRVAV